MDTLDQIAHKHGTDKAVGGPGSHHYTPMYEALFEHIRDQPIDLLEIGTQTGGSLLMWEEFFPNAGITGLDIAPVNLINTERVETIVGDFRDYKPDRRFDIVIDDGSHIDSDILDAYDQFLPALRTPHFYMVEDVQTSTAVATLPHRWLMKELLQLTA